MKRSIKRWKAEQEGRVLVPLLLWWAGLPFVLVFFVWLLFFRG